MTLNSNIQKVSSWLEEPQEWEEKYKIILDLGDSLEPFKPEEKTSKNLISGCVATVWWDVGWIKNKLKIRFDTDSLMAKGFLFIIQNVYQNLTVKEILSDDLSWIKNLQIDNNLSPQRVASFYNIVQKVQLLAKREEQKNSLICSTTLDSKSDTNQKNNLRAKEFLNKQSLGKLGETLVLEKYISEGYSLITQNFQYYSTGRGRNGEIDLILKKNDLIVLVEVKSRSNKAFGSALEQVKIGQINRIRRTWEYFCLKNQTYKNSFVRIDIATYEDGKVTIYKNIS